MTACQSLTHHEASNHNHPGKQQRALPISIRDPEQCRMIKCPSQSSIYTQTYHGVDKTRWGCCCTGMTQSMIPVACWSFKISCQAMMHTLLMISSSATGAASLKKKKAVLSHHTGAQNQHRHHVHNRMPWGEITKERCICLQNHSSKAHKHRL